MGFFPNFRQWNLLNNDTGQLIQGQFEAEDVGEERGSEYAERFTLNRKKAILHFLHGRTPTVNFKGRFYNETVLGPIPTFGDTRRNWDTLKTWAERDPILKRPPVLTFWIGDSWLSTTCVLEALTGIRYDQPGFLGSFKGVTFTANLREYTAFDIDQIGGFDTLYKRARFGDYYELLCQLQYNDPLLGVFIRQQHPTQANLKPGNIVKLPDREGTTIRTAKVAPNSVVFKDAFTAKSNPTRDRRLAMIQARNRSRVSHIVAE